MSIVIPVAILVVLLCLLVPVLLWRRKKRRQALKHHGGYGGAMPQSKYLEMPGAMGAGAAYAAGAVSTGPGLDTMVAGAAQTAAPAQVYNPMQAAVPLPAAGLDGADLDLDLFDAGECMDGALEAAEEVMHELDGMDETAVVFDSGISSELEQLKGKMAEMQTMDARGDQAHLVELAVGTTAALEQMEAKLEKSSAGLKMARAHATARSALTTSSKDLAHARDVLHRSSMDVGLSLNLSYIMEQVSQTCSKTATDLKVLQSELSPEGEAQAACGTVVGELTKVAEHSHSWGGVSEMSAEDIQNHIQWVDFGLNAIRAAEGSIEDMPEPADTTEGMLDILKRMRARLRHVESAARQQPGTRVRGNTISGELVTILQARRAGQAWKNKAVTDRKMTGIQED